MSRFLYCAIPWRFLLLALDMGWEVCDGPRAVNEHGVYAHWEER